MTQILRIQGLLRKLYQRINDITQAQTIFQGLTSSEKIKICLPVDRVGVNFGAALKKILEDRYGPQIEMIAADGAEFPGVALHALHMGFQEVFFGGDAVSLEALQQEAGALGAKIIPYDINVRNSLIKD